MSQPKPLLLVAFLVMLIAAIAGTWYYAQSELKARDVKETLQPIASLLDEDGKIRADLKALGAGGSDSALQDFYLAQIRKDSLPIHTILKHQIDRLVNDNTTIVALLDRYSSRARNPAFKSASRKFRDDAISLRDRWQSVFEIFMAGGYLPPAGPEFPTQLTAALAEELRAQ